MKKEVLIILFAILLINLVTAGELKVTQEHPFLINGRWIPAEQLKVGDELTTLDGSQIRITNIKDISLENPIDVYNIDSEKFDNFITFKNIIVHNSDVPETCPDEVKGFTIVPQKIESQMDYIKLLNQEAEEVANMNEFETIYNRNLYASGPFELAPSVEAIPPNLPQPWLGNNLIINGLMYFPDGKLAEGDLYFLIIRDPQTGLIKFYIHTDKNVVDAKRNFNAETYGYGKLKVLGGKFDVYDAEIGETLPEEIEKESFDTLADMMVAINWDLKNPTLPEFLSDIFSDIDGNILRFNPYTGRLLVFDKETGNVRRFNPTIDKDVWENSKGQLLVYVCERNSVLIQRDKGLLRYNLDTRKGILFEDDYNPTEDMQDVQEIEGVDYIDILGTPPEIRLSETKFYTRSGKMITVDTRIGKIKVEDIGGERNIVFKDGQIANADESIRGYYVLSGGEGESNQMVFRAKGDELQGKDIIFDLDTGEVFIADPDVGFKKRIYPPTLDPRGKAIEVSKENYRRVILKEGIPKRKVKGWITVLESDANNVEDISELFSTGERIVGSENLDFNEGVMYDSYGILLEGDYYFAVTDEGELLLSPSITELIGMLNKLSPDSLLDSTGKLTAHEGKYGGTIKGISMDAWAESFGWKISEGGGLELTH